MLSVNRLVAASCLCCSESHLKDDSLYISIHKAVPITYLSVLICVFFTHSRPVDSETCRLDTLTFMPMYDE